ncbi:helicase-related protein [Photobacterium sp. GB-36]|uniref:helicase-related protein n=1 Tax=Photobacterium sp. GB-36 TaxID=2022108 RepID=UPI000D166EEC|nr:DEAD/DEAH box helicase [Photobacterium sp. GB-36]
MNIMILTDKVGNNCENSVEFIKDILDMQNNLPIDSIEQQFKALLRDEHIVVEAETGSGKSTRLPLWAAIYGKVLVVEPRRVACTSLAEYLLTEEANPDQLSVGYAIRFEHHFDENTDIIYATPGVALRWLSEGNLDQFSTIIIDEFHERRWDTDLLLALLKQQQSHRLVITSATIDSQRLVNYLSAQHLQAKGRNFAVNVLHHTSDSRDMPDVMNIDKRITSLVQTHIDSHQDILIFLPGRKEIASTQNALTQQFSEQIQAGLMDIIPLHASVTDDERKRALTQSDKQRIIVATNVAETSVTIPGVTLIIDSGLERRTHQRNGRTVLSLHAISKASSEQRKGRAGRVTDGVCIRLYGKAAALELLTPPELQREELVEAYLAALCCNAKLSQLSFIDPLPEKTFVAAQQALLSMGAMAENEVITDYGRCLYQLPIDTLFAHLITAMDTRANKEAMVDLAAALSIPQRLWQPPRSEENIEQLYRWLGNVFCDATALIKMVRMDECPEWLVVDDNMLAEARLLSVQMRELLELPELSVASRFKRELWQDAVIKAVPELVFLRREKRQQAMSNGIIEVSSAKDSLIDNPPIDGSLSQAVIVFDQFALPGRGVKQNRILATCSSPVTLSQINNAELGELVQGDTIEQQDGSFKTAVQRIYAGRVIDTQWIEPEGQSARSAIVDMLLAGEVMPDLAPRIISDISQWNLYLALGLYNADFVKRAPEQVDAIEWLSQQIEDLGIEHIDDLELFEPSDFTFEGIPEWERQEFDERYPREVKLTDLVLAIEYDIHRKLVVANYQSGNRKPDPKRWELPRWQGWRVQYKKASRTIDIK